MTIRVFELTRHWAEQPVTVFAHDVDEAGAIYRIWVQAHYPEHPTEPDAVYVFDGARLEARPLLDAAAAQQLSGVGYWDAGACAWVISQPEEPTKGELTPPIGRVHYFDFKSDEGDDAKVIATSIGDAARLYSAWHRDLWGEDPSWFTVHCRSRWELVGHLATVRDALEAEISGVAAWDNDGVLSVLPPDFEPVIGRR